MTRYCRTCWELERRSILLDNLWQVVKHIWKAHMFWKEGA